jgi:hypothetical protein
VCDRQIWLNAGLDMRLKPYNVIATGVNDHGEGVGMLEVVTSSDTTSNIQVEFGGGAMGALRLNPIDDYLHHHNKDSKLYDRAVENFVRSCAGYCVATYVLGIGDRHNGNIMVTKSGHLFRTSNSSSLVCAAVCCCYSVCFLLTLIPMFLYVSCDAQTSISVISWAISSRSSVSTASAQRSCSLPKWRM